MRFDGRSILLGTACALAGVVVASFAMGDGGEETLWSIVRWSTRLGAPLFAAAFAARPLRQLSGGRSAKWLSRNRRELGLSFALMHFSHLAALAAIAWSYPEPFLRETGALTWIGGGIIYGLLAAMTVTSFDGPADWLGPQRWLALHRTGSYALWLILTLNYVTQALSDPRLSISALLLLGAAFARAGAWLAVGRRGRVGGEEPRSTVAGR